VLISQSPLNQYPPTNADVETKEIVKRLLLIDKGEITD